MKNYTARGMKNYTARGSEGYSRGLHLQEGAATRLFKGEPKKIKCLRIAPKYYKCYNIFKNGQENKANKKEWFVLF